MFLIAEAINEKSPKGKYIDVLAKNRVSQTGVSDTSLCQAPLAFGVGRNENILSKVLFHSSYIYI